MRTLRNWGICVIGLMCPLQAYAISPPQWDEFAKGEFIDKANVKVDGDIVAAYVRRVRGGRQITTLYEVDCKDDKIRVHSDAPRYISVPVEGGGRVVESDDGFRTVIPGSQNARTENAICEVAAREDMKREKIERQAECQRARNDDELRVMLTGGLTYDEKFCLLGLTHDVRYKECDKAGVPGGISVIQYLHSKGIFLECENHSEHR